MRAKRDDVILAGLIKEKIVFQTEEDLSKPEFKGKDQDEILLELAFCKRLDLLKYYRALGIVGGIVADKHKRAVHLLPSLSERFDDAHWVFPSVEPGNLCH